MTVSELRRMLDDFNGAQVVVVAQRDGDYREPELMTEGLWLTVPHKASGRYTRDWRHEGDTLQCCVVIQ
jgi:hypothetical protein